MIDPKYVKRIKPTTTFEPSSNVTKYRAGDYRRDEFGEGIVPQMECPPKRPTTRTRAPRVRDCSFPLTVYQTTIGEVARRFLCGEEKMERNVISEPPCNFCEFIEPPCRGYYRRHDCIRPEEAECIEYSDGERIYRNRIDRYWEPCLSEAARHLLYVKEFGQKNVKDWTEQ